MMQNRFFKIMFIGIFIMSCLNLVAQTNKQVVENGLSKKEIGSYVGLNENMRAYPMTSVSESINKAMNNTILLTEDFSSTTFPPAGWTVNIVTGTLGWTRGVGPQTYITFNPNGTTAANGYAFVNSDGNVGAGGAEHTTLRTPAINCVGHSYVWLRFNNLFYQYGASTGEVQVSNNGTAWNTVHSAHTGLGQHDATPNPQFVDVNISAWAANQATVYVRFKWTGNYDYYWFVDDVVVYSKNPYDVGLIAANNLNEYSVVPKVHYNNQPLALGATAKNFGGAAATNVYATINVYDGNTSDLIHTTLTNIAGSLLSGATTNLTASAFTIPLDTGYYVTEYIVSMAQQDSDSSNDTIYSAFWMSDSLYARDDAVFTGSLDGLLGIVAGGTAVMGQSFTLATNDILSKVNFYVAGQAIGDTTQAFIYSTLVDGTPNAIVAQTPYYIFGGDTGQWVSLQFTGGHLNLTAGTYFIGVKDFTSTDNLGLAYTDNNFTAQKSWVKINNDPWVTSESLDFPCAYIIRPYFVCAGFTANVLSGYNVGICQGLDATLTAALGSAYLWAPGGEQTQSITVNTPGTYSVSITNSYGCSAESDPITVVVAQNPVVNLGNDTTVCGSYTLNAGGPFASYSWTGGSNNQQLTVTATGQYIVVVTDTLGCVGLDSIGIFVNPLPIVNLGADQNVCDDQSVTLDAGTGFTNYMWNTQAVTQTIVVQGTSYGLGTHQFFVEVTDANNCTNTDTVNVTFIVCSGINDVNHDEMSVYPNPANGLVNIIVPQDFVGSADLKLFDVTGRLIIEELVMNINIKMNVSHLKADVYFIHIANDNHTVVRKLIVE